jgi:hypothetical protein
MLDMRGSNMNRGGFCSGSSSSRTRCSSRLMCSRMSCVRVLPWPSSYWHWSPFFAFAHC